MDLEKLIADNVGLVYKQLHKSNLAYDDDAFSYAMEALMKAAKTYDNNKGFAFSTYATVCIYNGIACYLRSLSKKRKLYVVSYDEPVGEDGESSMKDFLPDADTPDTIMLRKEFMALFWQKFDEVLLSMNDTAAKVILTWKESGYTATQMEMAERVGISQAQVSRALSTFKNRLKKEMEDYL